MFRFKIDSIEKGSLSLAGYEKDVVKIERLREENSEKKTMALFKIDLSTRELSPSLLRKVKLRVFIKNIESDTKEKDAVISLYRILNNIQLLSEASLSSLEVKCENIDIRVNESNIGKYIEFNITNIFKGWILNPSTNNGIALLMSYSYGKVNGDTLADILIEYEECNNSKACSYANIKAVNYRKKNEGNILKVSETIRKEEVSEKFVGIVAAANSKNGSIKGDSIIPLNVVEFNNNKDIKLNNGNMIIFKKGIYIVDWWVQTAMSNTLENGEISLIIEDGGYEYKVHTIRISTTIGVQGVQYSTSNILRVSSTPAKVKLVAGESGAKLNGGGVYAQIRILGVS